MSRHGGQPVAKRTLPKAEKRGERLRRNRWPLRHPRKYFPFHQSARVIPVIVVITKFRRYRGLTRRQQRQRERNASNISTRNNRLNENSEYLFLRILIFLNNFIFFFFLPSLIVLIIVRFIS